MGDFHKRAQEYLKASVDDLVLKLPTGVVIAQKYKCRAQKETTPPIQHIIHEEREKGTEGERTFNARLFSSATIASHGTLTASLVKTSYACNRGGL